MIILLDCCRRNELSMRPKTFVCGFGNITEQVAMRYEQYVLVEQQA